MQRREALASAVYKFLARKVNGRGGEMLMRVAGEKNANAETLSRWTDKSARAPLLKVWGWRLISLIFGVVMFFLAFFGGDYLAMIFTHDPEVIPVAALYLKAYAIDCVLVCPLFNMLGFLNGCGRTTFVMVQGLVAAFAIRVPLAVFFSQMPGTSLFFIGLAYPIATVLGILLCLGYLKTGRWRKGLEEFAGSDAAPE